MKKVIFSLVLVISIVIAAGIYYVLTNLDTLVKTAIEKYGSEATQTAVRVETIHIDLTDGAGAINGLTIANPKGFAMPYAFSLGEIHAGIDIQSLREEPYIINEITVLAPQVFVEINDDNKTNLNELMKNLMTGTSATIQAETQAASDDASAAGPRLIIRRVTFADGNIQAIVASQENKEYQLKLPSLNMTSLGGNKGATPSELAREIINRLIARASDEVKKKIIDQELDKLKAKASAKVEEEKARLKGNVDIKMEEETQKAKDKLKGLFGK